MLRWYDDESELIDAAKRMRPAMDAGDAYVEARDVLDGYCTACEASTRFRVATGVMLGAHPGLRDGLACGHCGLVNRCRLMLDAIAETDWPGQGHAVLLEATSPFEVALRRRLPSLMASEFFGPGLAPGTEVAFRGRNITHRSITDLGFADDSVSLVVHNDVLEHVPDPDAALAEVRRVLKPGGATVFTMPFFPFRSGSLLRGVMRDDGTIEHLQPPEYHGDPLSDEGVYTFHHFGPDFVQRVRNAGYARVEVGMDFDVFRGYTTNNYRYGDDALMPPIVFRAWG